MIKFDHNEFVANTIKESSDAMFYEHIFPFKDNAKKVNESSSLHTIPSFENKNDDISLSFKKKNKEENHSNVWIEK